MSKPFAFTTGDLFRHPGARHPVTLAGRLPDLTLSTTRVADDDVVAELVLEAQGDAVIASGTVSAHWTGECRRCLEATDGVVRVELREVFEPEPVEGETYPLGRDQIDVEPAVREALALALPLAPLCHDDCTGPDPDAHPVTSAPDAAEPSEDEPAPGRPPLVDTLDALHFDSN